MKTRIQIIFLILISALGVQSITAQSSLRKNVSGDFFSGMTLASMDIEGGNEYKKHKIGFLLGGNVNYKFYHNFQLQSGFYIMKKGLEKHEKSTNWIASEERLETKDITTTVDANYIQIPLNLGFEIPLTKYLFMNANFGFYGAYGFKGEKKKEGFIQRQNGGQKESQREDKTKTFSNESLSRWDYGIGGNFGFVYEYYLIKFQYDHGLANVVTDALGGKWRTRNYSIILGFRF